MYQQLYNLGIRSYGTAIKIAGAFNTKARNWVSGRQGLFEKLKRTFTGESEVIWFHAASLGEAEQGVPVMQELKKKYPAKKLLLTFFSPSGMDHFKNNGLADEIFYLPLDTPANAKRFLDAVQPQLAFFIKYEIWPNFFKEIQKRDIPLIIAPAIFREDQFYFKPPHRNYFLPILKEVDQILVQDENSLEILNKNGVTQVEVCGDSRFDRVQQNVAAPFESEVLEKFTLGEMILVGGSTWPTGEEILKQVLNENPSLKMIIAPHDIRPANVERVQKLFGKAPSFAYSKPPEDFKEKRVCVIDNIGMLSRLYRFGSIAYIGGAFGKGIHNSLEAAAYGLPLFFGPNHRHFIEPTEMIRKGFAFEIHDASEMQRVIQPMITDKQYLKSLEFKAQQYVNEKGGAVEKIVRVVEGKMKT